MSVFGKHPLPWKAAGFIISDANDSHVATAAGSLSIAAIIIEAVNEHPDRRADEIVSPQVEAQGPLRELRDWTHIQTLDCAVRSMPCRRAGRRAEEKRAWALEEGRTGKAADSILSFWCLNPQTAPVIQSAIAAIESVYGPVFASDMLVTIWKNASFLRDPRFIEAVQYAAEDDEERGVAWRLHTAVWAAQQAMNVPGDFVECGCGQGLVAGTICKYLDFGRQEGRSYFLYDTFAGLPEETSTEQERAAHAGYAQRDSIAWLELVRKKFAPWENVKIVRGVVPHSFKLAIPGDIAFLGLDMNSAKSEIMALDALWSRVSIGGYVLLDDFGWSTQKPQHDAEMQWFAEHGHTVLELATGQGLVVKHA